ncbi:hypothetical protein [Salinibacter altiplanensis]|uniref:hypothetical protein n=1 Tax=Salinibacter altiplanensis TaxID=1803181 RepID=UPI00131A5510|nr:hypothetical protein [Salinibacter altiplanensis]
MTEILIPDNGSGGNGEGPLSIRSGASEESFDFSSDPTDPDPEMSDAPDNTEKWVEERVARAEAKMEKEKTEVEKMTSKVVSKVDTLSDKQSTNRAVFIALGTTILLAIVSLFGYALNLADEAEDRSLKNEQRIEQGVPEPQADTSRSGQ